MKAALISAGIILLGAVIALLRNAAVYFNKRKENRREPSYQHQKLDMTKLIIWMCLANGIAWVWFSYYLAFKERTQIAESLSQVAVTEIIGVVLVYCIKSAVENLSKNNHWPDKTLPMEEEQPESTEGKDE